MVKEGLSLPDLSQAIEEIQRIDYRSLSAKATLSEFLEIRGAGQIFFEIGLKEIYEDFPLAFPIAPMEDAIEILLRLRCGYILALVTAGREREQRAKLKNAGIDSTLFSKIIVCEKGEKGRCYQALAEEFQIASSGVVVCGDRIALDLVPAKERGYRTIHMREGRGKREPRRHPSVDFTVNSLRELEEMVKR